MNVTVWSQPPRHVVLGRSRLRRPDQSIRQVAVANRASEVGMKLRKSVKDLCEEADAQIETWDVVTAIAHHGRPDVLLVDIRDVRELWRDGGIPGALHAPRCMLEFWIDPESKYAKPIFQSGRRFVFFCAGGRRSALATKTVQDMGLGPVCHIRGGYRAWKDAGGPTVRIEPKAAADPQGSTSPSG